MIGVTKPSDSVVYTARKLKLGGKILSLDKSRCQWKGLGVKKLKTSVKTNGLGVDTLV